MANSKGISPIDASPTRLVQMNDNRNLETKNIGLIPFSSTIGWHVSIEHSRKRSRTPFASRLYAVAPSDPRVGKNQRPCNWGYSRLSAGAADPVSETVIQCEVIILDSSPGRSICKANASLYFAAVSAFGGGGYAAGQGLGCADCSCDSIDNIA